MEFFIFHFKLHLISWPSLERCDSFLPFPPRPLFLVKENRAWLPLELISAAQLPPSCRLVEEAGLRLEQSSIGNLQGAFVSCTSCCLLYPLQWVQHECCRAWWTWGRTRVPGAACAKVTITGHTSKWLGSVSKGSVQVWSFSKSKLPSQRWPQKGMFRSTLWLMNCCAASHTSSSLEILWKWQANVKVLVLVVLSVLESLPSLELALDHALGASLSCPPL